MWRAARAEAAIFPEITAVYAGGTKVYTDDSRREIRVGRMMSHEAQAGRHLKR
ncbi:hypothetical protein JCM19992_19240 [Thermostilla marina]